MSPRVPAETTSRRRRISEAREHGGKLAPDCRLQYGNRKHLTRRLFAGVALSVPNTEVRWSSVILAALALMDLCVDTPSF